MSTVFKQAYVGDLQMPYQDNRAVALWFKAMKWWKPDAIDILGDIDDFLEFSSFADGTTDEFFNAIAKTPDESALPYVLQVAAGAREFYTDVRKAHPNADLFAALGNHEDRVWSYVSKKAPGILKEVTPESLWDLQNLGIDYIFNKDVPKERHGGMFAHHGNTTSTSNSLAVAKDLDNFGVNIVRGHSHQGGIAYKTIPLAKQMLMGMECGHMCDPYAYGLQYQNNPKWQLGFGLNHIVDGQSNLQFVTISPDYKCVVDGKLFIG